MQDVYPEVATSDVGIISVKEPSNETNDSLELSFYVNITEGTSGASSPAPLCAGLV